MLLFVRRQDKAILRKDWFVGTRSLLFQRTEELTAYETKKISLKVFGPEVWCSELVIAGAAQQSATLQATRGSSASRKCSLISACFSNMPLPLALHTRNHEGAFGHSRARSNN